MRVDDSGGWWGAFSEKLRMEVYLGGGINGGFQDSHWTLPASTTVQPIIFDTDSSLRPSLLGYQPPTSASGAATIRSWANNGSGIMVQAPPLQSPGQACQFANPHSSAYVDIDGDCLPDLVLHCERPQSSSRFIQIWINNGRQGYVLARSYDLPEGSGALSFADMDRDGTMDIIFPNCDSVSTSSGIGTGCNINIAYNQQVAICRDEASKYRSGDKLELACRGLGGLCQADEGFDFNFDPTSEYFTSIPVSSLLSTDAQLLLYPPATPSIPFPLRPGDFDIDGFTDLLITIANSTAAGPPGGIFGTARSPGTQVRVLENVPCRKGVSGCDERGRGRRGLRVGVGKGWEALDEIWDVTGASWMDIGDDGSLDILVQRTGEQSGQRLSFVQNNFYHDAFFLKAQVLNGACDGDCQPVDGGQKYSGLGVSYSGATYKFTVLDTLGRRVAQQVAQLPQTSYHALGTPYSFIGLGRTNNYVERLFVGASGRPPGHSTILESLIPNSQVIINPPFFHLPDQIEESPPVKARSKHWRSELFLHPGDWVPWVGAAVVGMVLVLGMVVVGLNEREKKEDEKERRRALHAINFQAL